MPSKPVFIRSKPPAYNNYHKYKEFLREDFGWTCAYCYMTEDEAKAIGFSIDHYFPQSQYKNLINDYDNLYWVCNACQNNKRDEITSQEQYDLGYDFIRPDLEHPFEHLVIEGNEVDHLTKKGHYHRVVLRLNDPRLKLIREKRREQFDNDNYIMLRLNDFYNVFKKIQFPPDKKSKYYKIYKEIKTIVKLINEQIEIERMEAKELRKVNKSHLIDTNKKEKEKQLKQRRSFLNEIKAKTPETIKRLPDKNIHKF